MITDTRTKLLDAAEHAVRTRGFDGFSYADLSRAVGIRKASIHYHFPTKAALSSALMTRYHANLEAACDRIEAQRNTGAGRLLAIVALYRDALKGGSTLCLCVSLIGSCESLSDEVIASLRAFRKMMLDRITAIFELGAQDATILGSTCAAVDAQSTLALLEGAHLAARIEQSEKVFDGATDILTHRFCRRHSPD
ncbi:MAG: TetR/AcrR family transcriptional regulator [Pseudomonadota bacterium]